MGFVKLMDGSRSPPISCFVCVNSVSLCDQKLVTGLTVFDISPKGAPWPPTFSGGTTMLFAGAWGPFGGCGCEFGVWLGLRGPERGPSGG